MYNKPWKTYLCDIVSRISTSAGLWLSEIVQFVKAGVISVDLKLSNLFVVSPSSETQGRSVGPGEKARRKFPSTGGKAPGYRLPPDHFQTVKRMLAPDWAQKNALYYCAQSVSSHLLSSFCEFVHDGYWLDHGLSGSCTKEMHPVRNLSVWYKRYNTVYTKTKDALPKLQAWAYNRYRLHRSRLRKY